MITLNGKTHIKRYLAGFTSPLVTAIAFGIGNKAEANTDTALQFEVGREIVKLTSYDFVNNKLIYKADVPAALAGTIYEVGIFSQANDPQAGNYGSRLITSFDSATEAWIDTTSGLASTYTATGARIGADALILSPAASATVTSQMANLNIDLIGNSDADRFNFAYTAGANVASLVLRFKNDANNYYTYTVSNPATGYAFTSLPRGSATVTGVPSWGAITTIEAAVTAKAAGAASVTFDGIRVEDVDTINPNYVMVSRELLNTPYVTASGMVQEIEFALDVSV